MKLCDSQPAHCQATVITNGLAGETKFVGQPYDPTHHTQLHLLSCDIPYHVQSNIPYHVQSNIPYHVQSWINSESSVSATASVYIAK